jgi:hypothetical protein
MNECEDHTDSHAMVLSSKYVKLTLTAIQWLFINICEAHTDRHAMVLSPTYVELTIMTKQCFFLQLKPEPFHANLPITHSCNAVHHTRHFQGNVAIASQFTLFKQPNKHDILLFACQLSAKIRIKLVSEYVHVYL